MPADLRALLLEACDIARSWIPSGDVGDDAMRIDEISDIARSLADQPEPPGVMTVAKALMLPQVRDGSVWVEWTRSDDNTRWRVEAHDGELGHRWRRENGWSALFECTFTLLDLDAPCTLISSQGGAR
jgi:hypothetical protein